MIIGTTWLGTLPAWLTFAGLIIGLRVFRGSSPGAALEMEQRANQTLSKRVDLLEANAKTDRETIAALTAKTDISIALVPLLEWCKSHEALAQARAASILAELGTVI